VSEQPRAPRLAPPLAPRMLRAGAALRAAARRPSPRAPLAPPAAQGGSRRGGALPPHAPPPPPLPPLCLPPRAAAARNCSGTAAAAAAAAAASAAPQGLASLWALKRLAFATAGGSTAAALALALSPPAYVLPPAAAASLAATEAPTLRELIPRGAALLVLFTPLALLGPAAALLPSRALRQAWYRLLTWTLARAGCAFIKWGQWAATRPDLFPPDMVR
jgi:hypothetical protein